MANAPRKPQAKRPMRGTIAIGPDGKTYRTPDAQFDAVFRLQRQRMRDAAVFLSGFAHGGLGVMHTGNERTYSVDGLGELPTKDSLLLGPDGKFSNQRFEELKKILYDALGEADKRTAMVKTAAQKAADSWAIEALSPTKTTGVSLLKNAVPNAERKLRELRGRVDRAVASTMDPLWSTLPPKGRKQTYYDQTLGEIQQEVAFAGSDLQLLDVAFDNTFFAGLGQRSLEMLKTAYKVGEKIVSAAADTVGKALETAKSNIDAGLWLTRNWYWLAIGGGVMFFVVPPVLRTIRAARSGGIDAAAQSAEQSLIDARAGIARGAATAGKAAINLTPQGRALTMASAASKMLPGAQTAGLGRVVTRRRSQSKRRSR